MLERAFVLVPLKDVYFNEEILGLSVDELIARCGDKDGIKLYGKLDDWRGE
jgi:2-amino-4-hydroxy-6-hydroxymethyldihydropteridine diphosphokinase